MKRVGYIGIGQMGSRCVLNLLKASYSVYIYARTPQKAADLVAQGAVLCDSPAALADQTDICCTNVTASADVENLLFGSHGICHGAKADYICADMSTCAVSDVRGLAQRCSDRDMYFLDAPVSGGIKSAQDGTLAIWVGGKEEVYQRALPVFQAMGDKIRYMGASGAGQITKSCNQLISSSTMLAICDMLRLCQASGIEPMKVRDALLNGGSAACFGLQHHMPRMLMEDAAVAFTFTLACKDHEQIVCFAREHDLSLPSTERAARILRAVVDNGYGNRDNTSIYQIFDEMEDDIRKAGQ